MHNYLRKKLSWYRQWHEQWFHNYAHWVVFTCAVLTATSLFSYILHSAPGQAIVADVVPVVYAQAVIDEQTLTLVDEVIPPIPVVPDRVKK